VLIEAKVEGLEVSHVDGDILSNLEFSTKAKAPRVCDERDIVQEVAFAQAIISVLSTETDCSPFLNVPFNTTKEFKAIAAKFVFAVLILCCCLVAIQVSTNIKTQAAVIECCVLNTTCKNGRKVGRNSLTIVKFV